MVVSPRLKRMMTQVVRLQMPTGEGMDRWGHMQYRAPTFHRASITEKPQAIRTNSGEEAVSNATIVLEDAPGVDTDWLITLPDGRQPQILSVNRHWDFRTGEPHHETIYT